MGGEMLSIGRRALLLFEGVRHDAEGSEVMGRRASWSPSLLTLSSEARLSVGRTSCGQGQTIDEPVKVFTHRERVGRAYEHLRACHKHLQSTATHSIDVWAHVVSSEPYVGDAVVELASLLGPNGQIEDDGKDADQDLGKQPRQSRTGAAVVCVSSV